MSSKKEKDEFNQYLIELVASSISRMAIFTLAFYLSFMIWDVYAYPHIYPTMWGIRIAVVSICLSLLYFKKSSFIQKYRRVFFPLSVSLVVNSTTLLWSLRNPDVLPRDVSIAAVVLMFVMAGLRMVTVDALIVGAIYCVSFCLLLISRNAPSQVWLDYSMSLGLAYLSGAICATVAEHYLFKTFRAEKLLRQETERADNLLDKTFPSEVAKELKLHQKSQAKRFDNVTVMFCDIVSFTQASSAMQPEALVEWLNEVFSIFDRLAEEHGCEKIKTIGDAYMAVCGAPSPVSDHAHRVVKLAMALNKEVRSISLNGVPLTLRIGINSGPVVAGVIGKNRFAYDLWGDTVNIASRMESLSVPGKILVTESTKVQLPDIFQLEKVGALNVKGKGQMDAWHLTGYKVGHQLQTKVIAA